MRNPHDSANTTPARLSFPADFGGQWRVTAQGVESTDHAILIEPTRLWEGIAESDPARNSWERWAQNKNRHFDAVNFLKAIRYARRVFAAQRPNRVPAAIVEPIDADDPLDYWRRRDLFHADVPSAEFTDAKKGVSVRAERRGGRFLLFVCGVRKRVIRDVHLRRRRDGRPYICPPFPSRWTSAAIQAIELLTNNGQEVAK